MKTNFSVSPITKYFPLSYNQEIETIYKEPRMNSHGGAREGSGRKRKWGILQEQPTRGTAIPDEIPQDHFDRIVETYLRHRAEGTESEWLRRILEN
jgi:hypothetical protein